MVIVPIVLGVAGIAFLEGRKQGEKYVPDVFPAPTREELRKMIQHDVIEAGMLPGARALYVEGFMMTAKV